MLTTTLLLRRPILAATAAAAATSAGLFGPNTFAAATSVVTTNLTGNVTLPLLLDGSAPFPGAKRHYAAMGSNASTAANFPKGKTDAEWRTQLSPEQFRILRQKGTEMGGTGEYDRHYPTSGVYNCAGCDSPLYKASHKFKSGCGWPAYFDSIPGAIDRHVDRTFGMKRVEITCRACGGHLGHVFEGEGFDTPTDERHCVNSVSLKFSPEDTPVKGGPT